MASIVHTDTPYLDRLGTKALLEEIKERIPGADVDMTDYYTKSQVDTKLPKKLADLNQDNNHQTVTATEKASWSNRAGLATEEYVRSAIASAELSGGDGEVDLTDYATKTYVDSAVSNVTPNMSGYATQSYVNNAVANATPNLSGYATQTYVNNAIAAAELDGNSDVDLSGYATVDHTHSEYASTNHSHTSINKAGTIAPVPSSDTISNANVECPVEGLRFVDVYEPGQASKVPIAYGNMLQMRSGNHNNEEGQSGFAHEMMFGTDNNIYHRSHGDYGNGNKWENWKRLADIDETMLRNVKVDATDDVFRGQQVLTTPELPQLPTFEGGTKLYITPPDWVEDYWSDVNVAVRMRQDDGYLHYDKVNINEDDTKDYVLIPDTGAGFIDDYELFGSDYQTVLALNNVQARKVQYLLNISECPPDFNNAEPDPSYFSYDGTTKIYDNAPLITKKSYVYIQPYAVSNGSPFRYTKNGQRYDWVEDRSTTCYVLNYDVSNLTGSVVVRFNAFYPKYDPNSRVSSHYDGAGNYTPYAMHSTSKYKISNVPSYQGAQKCRITNLYLCQDLNNNQLEGTTLTTTDLISRKITNDYAEIVVDVTNRDHMPLLIWGPQVGVYESDTYYGNAPVENLTTTSWQQVALYANPIFINHNSSHPDYDPDFDSPLVVVNNFGINPADIKNAPIIISLNTEGVDTEYSIWTTNIDGTESSEVNTISFSNPVEFNSKDVLRYSNEPIFDFRDMTMTDFARDVALTRADIEDIMSSYKEKVNVEIDSKNQVLSNTVNEINERVSDIINSITWKYKARTKGIETLYLGNQTTDPQLYNEYKELYAMSILVVNGAQYVITEVFPRISLETTLQSSLINEGTVNPVKLIRKSYRNHHLVYSYWGDRIKLDQWLVDNENKISDVYTYWYWR